MKILVCIPEAAAIITAILKRFALEHPEHRVAWELATPEDIPTRVEDVDVLIIKFDEGILDSVKRCGNGVGTIVLQNGTPIPPEKHFGYTLEKLTFKDLEEALIRLHQAITARPVLRVTTGLLKPSEFLQLEFALP